MRVWKLVTWLSAGLGLAACSDDKPDPLVNGDVSWQVGCPTAVGCLSLRAHVSSPDIKERFEVDCSSDGTGGYNVTLLDPGSPEDMRPKSVVTITRLNPERPDACYVEVLEAEKPGDNARTYKGSCREGACQVTGALDAEGWEFAGTIKCTGLQVGDDVNATKYTLIKGGSNNEPVELKVDNCD